MGSLSYAVLTSLFLLSKEGETTTFPEKVDAPISRIYSVGANAENEPSQLVAEVEFPSSCYSLGSSRVELKPDHNVILFHLQAYKQEAACSPSKVTTSQVIEVGVLPEGEYEVRDYKRLHKWGHLKVEHLKAHELAKANLAPVDEIQVKPDPSGLHRLISIRGKLPNSCSTLKVENISVTETNDGVIEVEPRMMTDISSNCVQKPVPYTKVLAVPTKIRSGRYLIHVAGLDTKAFHKIESIENHFPWEGDFMLSSLNEAEGVSTK